MYRIAEKQAVTKVVHLVKIAENLPNLSIHLNILGLWRRKTTKGSIIILLLPCISIQEENK